MKLSPLCEKAYLHWISVDTWHTSHPLDKSRFYNFVSICLQHSRSVIQASDLKSDILEKYRGKLDPMLLDREAETYSLLFVEIIAFVKATNR
jgi:hypothetical protein